MPKLTSGASNKTNEDSIPGKLEQVMGELVVSTNPVVICGVQRKANIGNFETIDIYCAVTLPMGYMPEDINELKQALEELAEEGFKITSQETHARYQLIKESLK